jgi:D-glycero-beta-D-manno-heptose-7-phosphate kinase
MKYKDVDLIILNHNEAKTITHLNSSKDEEVAEFLADALSCDVVITRGHDGMLLKTDEGFFSYPVIGHCDDEVIDVTGAGDTVTASIGGFIAAGLDLVEAVRISNVAADIVIRKRGTSTFTLDELLSRPTSQV